MIFLDTDSALMQPNRVVFPTAWVGHIPFAAWLVSLHNPAMLVELGTHTGNSYLAFCQAVQENDLSTKCYAVDTWQGDAHAGKYSDDIFQELSCYHDAKYGAFSRLLRMTFDDALSSFEEGSIDLLHIDGFHTYEAVTHDFETWLPKLSGRGIVLFHDTNVRERDFGVWRLWDELSAQHPSMHFDHSNGLGVLFVGGKILPEIHAAIDAYKSNPLLVKRLFAGLGQGINQQYDLIVAKQQLKNLGNVIAERDGTIAERDSAITERHCQLAILEQRLNEILSEQGVLQSNLSSMRRSSSWRITAPLRFVGHIVKGDFGVAANVLRQAVRRVVYSVPGLSKFGSRLYGGVMSLFGVMPNSGSNQPALDAIVVQRCKATESELIVDPLCPSTEVELPSIDIGIVTYNSSRWVAAFVDSLINLDYPKEKLTIHFVDNSSTDSTIDDLKQAQPKLVAAGFIVEIIERPNRGFGAGHNAAFSAGKAPFCLVSNIDLVFERDSLLHVASIAVLDIPSIAAWELRQKPYEHPKNYDPITGITNWNSHACVLLRRTALEGVGGYDETLFMYGEDVELSYRLRRAGFMLRYCPRAVVWHYTYDEAVTKPLQYIGSTFSNLYLRLKYGNYVDALSVPLLGLKLLAAPQLYSGARKSVIRSLLQLAVVAPKALLARRHSNVFFPFRAWDYELTREGALLKDASLPDSAPLVSIITRTYKGRELYLRQALLSVAHQSYPNIEHIVVEDGGSAMQAVVENVSQVTGKEVKFIGLSKLGRSAAGNTGLAAAQGRWCLFLDDDDLLFADHIESLVVTLLENTDTVAAYSLAWEVVTDSANLSSGSYLEVEHTVQSLHRQYFDYAVLRHHNFMSIQSVLFERQLFEERGGFDLDMDALEDWVLWAKYAMGNRFHYLPKVTSMYRTPLAMPHISERNRNLGLAYPLASARIAGNEARYGA